MITGHGDRVGVLVLVTGLAEHVLTIRRWEFAALAVPHEGLAPHRGWLTDAGMVLLDLTMAVIGADHG
jgi:hypothetical protein